MSIVVDHITKVFGSQRAVDQLSFTANKGEILGFLGPNGAGKSTTMKMIVGYLTASEGSIQVCGLDVQTHPIETKAKIGYLPEHNPLYKSMYVKEYLKFVGKLSGIKSNVNDRVEELLELTGLQREQHKKIEALSKGYRQRVGIAQAMFHDPEVIILDEPTSGLDPNQLVEIRALIKSLGKDKTVILSTHIMQEVTALCDRVVIIDQGKLKMDKPITEAQNLLEGAESLELEFARSMEIRTLELIKGVQSVETLNNGKYRLQFAGNDIREDIFRLAVEKDNPILMMNKSETSMEEVFQNLTQAHA